MNYFISLFLIFYVLTCHAAIYMQKDKNGNMTYSDTPLNPGSEIISHPDEINIQNTPDQTNTEEQLKASNEVTKATYTEFSITSPSDNETFQNQPVIDVTLKIEPELQKDDRIQYNLDGTPIQAPTTNTQISMTNVPRGTHTLSAQLLNKDNQVIKESSITIYVHQGSVNQPSRQ